MNIHNLYRPFMRRFRPRRMRAMAQYFALTEDTNVLDVGGNTFNWTLLPFRPQLTILNRRPRPENFPDWAEYVEGDALDLPFDDKSFDLVYSNSVIEHVGRGEKQARMADEIRRVGRSYYVQTPNYWFPVEPHVIMPVFHWFPEAARRKLIRNSILWGIVNRPPREQCEWFVDSIHLLTKRDMATLFEDADWLNEKFLGMDKSIIAAFRGSHAKD